MRETLITIMHLLLQSKLYSADDAEIEALFKKIITALRSHTEI